jgi:prevent-host-death family protein
MDVLSVQQAKRRLSQLVKRAAAGETILIGRKGNASAMLVPAAALVTRKKQIGILAGKLYMPEDFDGPLPEVELAAFEGLFGATDCATDAPVR